MLTKTSLFFCTDIHASTKCFKKFLAAGTHYKADVLVLGGDVTGKAFIPIVSTTADSAVAWHSGERITLATQQEVRAFEARSADAGFYTFRCTREELQMLEADEQRREQAFERLICQRMHEWVELADTRLRKDQVRVFFNGGNDDAFAIDEIIDSSRVMRRPEAQCIEIDAFCTMISCGFANLTPFNCPRDISEPALAHKIDDMLSRVPEMARCIFNLHCPPYGSQLDNAVTLQHDLVPKMSGLGVEHAPVGSTAVRAAIESRQPLLGLHGHIHESKGAVRIGRTLCINPGSEYHEGLLRGALVQLANGSIQNFALTCG